MKDQDIAQCQTKMDPDAFKKLSAKKGVPWGKIQMVHEYDGGEMYLICSRAHVAVAHEAAKAAKAASWDASGIQRSGVMISPILMPSKGTSGKSRLAAAPAIVGWLVFHRDDKKYGIDAATLKSGWRSSLRFWEWSSLTLLVMRMVP